MSNEPKKYPADTPVTLGMVVDHHERHGMKLAAERWREWIEPPKPEPKDGELWLCYDYDYGKIAYWRCGGMWYKAQLSPGVFANCIGTKESVQLIKRLLPSEASDE